MRNQSASQIITPFGETAQQVTGKYKSVDDVMREFGLDWTVRLEPTFLADKTEIPNSFVTRRESDGAILGVVGNRYKPLQNVDAFRWFDPFLQSGLAEIKTVGNFKGGRLIFIQAEVNTEAAEIVKGDTPIKAHITLGHAHDGSKRIMAGFTAIRPWCQNQLPMMARSKSTKMLSMKHTKHAVITLDAIRDIMDIFQCEFKASMDQMRFLASKGVRKKDIEKFVTLVYAKEGRDADKTKKIETITHLFENGRGLGQSNMKNYYGLLNAVAEDLTWNVGRTVDNRMSSLMFGENLDLEQRAFQLAIDLASGKKIEVPKVAKA